MAKWNSGAHKSDKTGIADSPVRGQCPQVSVSIVVFYANIEVFK